MSEIRTRLQGGTPFFPNMLNNGSVEVCLKEDVDNVLAEKDKEIAELKADYSAEVEELCIEKTNVDTLEQAWKRSQRALWLARAERAKEKQQLFHFSLGYEKLCIDGFYDPYSGRRELSPKQWIKAFNKVEVKLLKKAEEYK